MEQQPFKTITPEMVAQAGVRVGDLNVYDDVVYWVESRPKDGGRCSVVQWDLISQPKDILSAPWSARSRVHEYGGGAIVPTAWGLIFSNDSDQALYLQDSAGVTRALTSTVTNKQVRFSDGTADERRKRIICVREDHRSNSHEPKASLVVVPVGENKLDETFCGIELISGNDFYSSPRISPDGKSLCWITWNHPRMPWHGTELWTAAIEEDGTLSNQRLVAGGAQESILQPEWALDGRLFWISDASGYWNVWCLDGPAPRNIWDVPVDCGRPPWAFGVTTYAILSHDELAIAVCEKGVWSLQCVSIEIGRAEKIECKHTEIVGVRVCAEKIVVLGSSPSESPGVIATRPGRMQVQVGRNGSGAQSPESYSLIETRSPRGMVYSFYYPPFSKAERPPPLLLKPHGGPVSQAAAGFNMQIQYWQSRGFAFVDVNYGGSTGFGRAYRERLKHNWGVVDVEDCLLVIDDLVKRGFADERKIFVSGSSAGGFTLLSMMAKDKAKRIRAGAIYYGVTDLEALSRETHKFERHELGWLIAPPERFEQVLRERSPCNFVEKISTAVIVFQGTDDQVVPPNQSEQLVEKLKQRNVTVAYHTFAGEGHGFRRADTTTKALELEEEFFRQNF